MRANGVTGLVAVAAAALFLTSSAEAKFSLSVAVEPARPVAGQLARTTIRTGIVLPSEHGLQLHAVGPWRARFGQAFFDVRLVRIGPRAFRAKVRFPYAGRWRLVVAGTSPLVAWPVRVRPRN